ncbi:MAG: integration host factor subunit beta [Acidobacteriaceae bacterium]|nr:integration host factor subunit beta [Acidobacteriaceae bacterium]
MTKSQLIDSVSTTTGQSKAEIERTLEAILKTVVQALASGERIDFRGFGTFTPKETKARTGRNPRTGEAVPIAAKRKVTFRPSQELKDRLTAPAASETQA